MGKQYNKAEKRKRRSSYIKRKKAKTKVKQPTATTAPAPPVVVGDTSSAPTASPA